MNVTANLPEIYKDVIETIRASVELAHGPTIIKCSATPSECISLKKTYSYEFYCHGAMLFTLPKVVMEEPYDQRGYFIVDGIERFVMIQEIIRKNIFTLHHVDDKITCTIKLPKAYKKLEIVLKDCEFTINNNSLRNFIIGVPPMSATRSIFETIQQCFSTMDLDESVRKICLLYMSLGDTQIRPRELDINEIKPYFGNVERESVIATLVYMAYLCTGCFIGKISPTDLSSYQNKSFRSYPEMVHDAFFRIRNMSSLNKKLNDTLVTSIKTGVFEIFGRRYDNMVTTVSRRSPLDAVSSVRKIIVPTDENTKNIEMRLINPTTRMFVCPSETPEGRRVGLVKTLATNCVISRKIDEEQLVRDIVSLEKEYNSKKCVLINGQVHFFKVDFEQLLELKCRPEYLYLSVSKHRVIELRADGGRLMRPALGGRMADAMETEPDVDSSWMLGLSASLIPFSEHNQCARAVFASSMLKQAMTLVPSPPNHVDHKHLLHAQTPLIYTRVGKELDIHNNGIHMTVAICTWLGFNQEDAIVMKKSFAERIGPLSKYVMNIIIDMNINDKFILQTGGNDKYDKNGVIQPGQKVQQNDPLIVLAVHTEGGHYQVKSYNWERDETATVDDVLYGNGWIRFRIGIIRGIEIGDKLASRHAQKGILNVVVPDGDLPFDEEGNIPDIIINPHAIPSRMTVGQLIESQLSQLCCTSGKFIDGTIFNKISKEIDNSCMKLMYNPFTGEIMKSNIHVGTVYYMFLAHQVKDKIHHRFYGDNSIFSNQPVSGRSKHGGLRIGEMEMDMLLTHGASQLVTTVIKESDMTTALVCKDCGYMLSSVSRCILCDSENMVTLDIPFAFKNMANVLQIAGIKINAQF